MNNFFFTLYLGSKTQEEYQTGTRHPEKDEDRQRKETWQGGVINKLFIH